MYRAKFKVGLTVIEVEANDKKELIKKIGFFSGVPTQCGLCDSTDLKFFQRSPGGNLYLGMACSGCGAEFNFSQHKDGGGLFIKGDQQWRPAYGGNDHRGATTVQRQAPPQHNVEDEDDIPF